MNTTKTLLYTAVLASMAATFADANAFLVAPTSLCDCACMYPAIGNPTNTALPAYALAPSSAALQLGDAYWTYEVAPNPSCKAINGTACKGWSGSVTGGTARLQNGVLAACS
jgi:hypothetical protein